MGSVFVAARRDRRNRTTVLGTARVGVDALVQLRRNTQRKCPDKRGENTGRDECASVVC